MCCCRVWGCRVTSHVTVTWHDHHNSHNIQCAVVGCEASCDFASNSYVTRPSQQSQHTMCCCRVWGCRVTSHVTVTWHDHHNSHNIQCAVVGCEAVAWLRRQQLCDTTKLTAIIQSCRLTLFGHIMRMDDNADAKRILLASPLADWRRQLGRPRITWLSTIQQDLKHQHLTLPEAADLAQNRPLWRMMSTYGATLRSAIRWLYIWSVLCYTITVKYQSAAVNARLKQSTTAQTHSISTNLYYTFDVATALGVVDSTKFWSTLPVFSVRPKHTSRSLPLTPDNSTHD